MTTIKVKYYCGCAVGAPYWQNTETYESDECDGEGVVEVPKKDWDAKAVYVNCAKCESELNQCDDNFELYETKEGRKEAP